MSIPQFTPTRAFNRVAISPKVAINVETPSHHKAAMKLTIHLQTPA